MSFDLRKAKKLWAEFATIRAETHASSIAYFTFLSLIPLLILCISLVTMIGFGESEVTEFLCAIVPDTFDAFVRTLVNDAFRQSGVAFSLSTITLLWTASQGIRALYGGLNAAYGEQEERNALVVVAISVGMAVAFGVLLTTTIYLVFGDTVVRAASSAIPELESQKAILNVVNSAAMATLGTVVLAACYTYLPSGSRRFVEQLPGAAVASLACGVLTVGFHVYVDNFSNFDALYGSLSTVALFLFWMYIVSYILIACAFLNRALSSRSWRKVS